MYSARARLLFAIFAFALLSGASPSRRALPQGAYVWQRKWTPALRVALNQSSDLVHAWRVLAAYSDTGGDFKSGNQIMGTEGPPDNYAEPSLSFSGIGQFELPADDRFVTDGERQRFKASALKPNFRYHYLYVGVDEAIHAADLLPPRSQAFAAVLCNAISRIHDGMSCPVSASDLRRTRLGSEAPVDTSIRKANERQIGYEPVRVDACTGGSMPGREHLVVLATPIRLKIPANSGDMDTGAV